MSKRKLFNPDVSDGNISLRVSGEMSPYRGGIHPALIATESSAVAANKNNKYVDPTEILKKLKPDSRANAQDSDSDSDSDPMEVPFFSQSVQKMPYTKEEDEIILKYVLKGQNIYKVGSILLWKHLEYKKDNPKRTYHSLKNRFLRNIKPVMFTTFAHLTKDKETAEKILAKFPELKHSLGRREVLSKIKLPERKPPPTPPEEDRVSSTSFTDIPREEVIVSQVRSLEPEPVPVCHPRLTRNEPEHLNVNSVKSVVYERTIKTNGNAIVVCVDFSSKKSVDVPSLGIYEMYEKLKRENRFGFCPTCGRYNVPKRVKPLKYNKEMDIIPNSVETPQSSSKSSTKKKLLGLKGKNGTTPKRGKTSSQHHGVSPCSPSLLSDVVVREEVHSGTPEQAGKGSQVTAVSLRKDASAGDNKQKSSSRTEKLGSNDNRNKMLRMATANSASAKEANSGTAKRRRDSDDDIESFCEDALLNFRKLIDDDEEQQLAKKCLNRNIKSMGLDEVSQSNWDSYFLESSSDDFETPPLTIDCEAESEDNRENATPSRSHSSPTKNTKKRVGKKK